MFENLKGYQWKNFMANLRKTHGNTPAAAAKQSKAQQKGLQIWPPSL